MGFFLLVRLHTDSSNDCLAKQLRLVYDVSDCKISYPYFGSVTIVDSNIVVVMAEFKKKVVEIFVSLEEVVVTTKHISFFTRKYYDNFDVPSGISAVCRDIRTSFTPPPPSTTTIPSH